MSCESWREEISALADGETSPIDTHLLDAHLTTCADCRAYQENIHRLRRAMVGTAPEMNDLSGRVRKLAAIADRAGRWGVVRALLAVVAVEIIVLSLPALILGEEHATSAHAARHLGAFTVAYAAGLLVVVARPARARTMLPVALILAASLVITGVVDIVNGDIPFTGEAAHLPELISVALIWLLAASPRRAGHDQHEHERRPLRLVDETTDAERHDETG
jgi:predicted anti-sigma-YlaC factor YlaD